MLRATFTARKLGDVNRAYDAFLLTGVPLADYPDETLQCRNELDRTNWMELRDICREAIAAERAYYEANELDPPEAGYGAMPITAPGIRCTSNNFIQPTVAETLVILDGIRTWAMAAQANWWSLKDAVRDAETNAELNAIDVTEGYP